MNVFQCRCQEIIFGHFPAFDVLVQVLERAFVAMDLKSGGLLTTVQTDVVQNRTYLIVTVRIVLAETPLGKTGFIHPFTINMGQISMGRLVSLLAK